VKPDAELTWAPRHPTDVHLTLSRLRRGSADPTHHVAADGSLWRTTLMDTGGATMRLTQRGLREITCEAYGPGAAEAVSAAPVMLGAGDDDRSFIPRHPLLSDAHRRFTGLRIPRTMRVLEALVPAILEQKVIAIQATASWRMLVREHGSPAPGPTPVPMRIVPSPRDWATIPSWEWHRAGVDPRRSRTVVNAARVSHRLEEATMMDVAAAADRLCAVPGVGEWTAAETAQRAFGDADALSVGDYHLAGYIGHAMFGRPFTDDDMLEALEPWRGHRYRVVRLLESAGVPGRPRRGPRMSLVDHRGH
jgi:3-methyladenine DNA glycosylase/8-oxoguanine DNA glycosylase